MIDVFSLPALEDPYDIYTRLQHDSPVHQLAETGIWLVSRHADLVEAASKPDIFSSHISAIIYAGQGTNPSVIAGDPDAIGAVDVLATQDPPIHTKQRRLMNRTFTHARIAVFEPLMREVVEHALAEAVKNGQIEWMGSMANPLPVTVIAAMLGMPDEDLDHLGEWSDAGVDLLSGVATAERMAECWQQMITFLAYLRERLRAPTSGSITADVADAVARDELEEREAVSLLLQLVIAGSESTASLMGSAARILASDGGLQSDLRSDPARIPAFLEEALRVESPFRGHFRVATQDTVLGGVRLPKGARVMLLWGAANRDPEAFAQPEAVDCARDHVKGHVAFGSGIHFCLGAPLARMEAKIAIGELLARTSSFSLAEQPRHVPSLFVRRVESLQLSLSGRQSASAHIQI
jgi:cytochrome P450 family 144